MKTLTDEEKRELTEAAAYWDKLADEEEARVKWDRCLLPQIAASRADMYRRTAEGLRLQRADGVPRCACHLLSLEACRQLAQRRR